MAKTAVKKPEPILVKRSEDIVLNLFAVRNSQGKWFMYKSHDYNYSWTDNITNAKLYTAESSAKRQVTYWFTNHPDKGMPELINIVSGKCEVIEQTVRVKAAAKKKAEAIATTKISNLDYRIKNYLDTNINSKQAFNKAQLSIWQEQLLEAKHQLKKIKAL